MKRKAFKGMSLFIVMLALSSGTLGQKPGYYQSKKHTSLTPDDGAAYLNLMQYDDKSKFMYLISNDDSNLYVDVIITDRSSIQKTMMYGLTTWIDPAGKKKKALGIEFPLSGGNREQGSHYNRGGNKSNGDKDRKAMMAMALQEKNRSMVLTGFTGKKSEEEVNPSDNKEIWGKVEIPEEGRLRVIMKISLAKLGLDSKTALNTPFSLGFETGYMDLNRSGMATGSNMQGGGDHYHEGHPGGGPPGGMDQSGGPPQQANLNQLASPSRVWIKKILLSGGN